MSSCNTCHVALCQRSRIQKALASIFCFCGRVLQDETPTKLLAEEKKASKRINKAVIAKIYSFYSSRTNSELKYRALGIGGFGERCQGVRQLLRRRRTVRKGRLESNATSTLGQWSRHSTDSRGLEGIRS
ncbi:hypothetical protein BT96DRAFT_273734 [Gymnopus androsaceus JB14]|uniref:Uncharacterized protein n=1 Tax=Gymnopus androsaceus JB14 TaxID=1447944 RepID=A0A6A4H5D3_9AGAR|nr:hypothetical protein BT96DRAFT_273734 [Gymnopus androsaceus JB14]